MSKKRKEIEVSVPARIQELGFGCPHVVVTQLQKSVGDVWPRISSANALQKERTGSSEQGSSSSLSPLGETNGGDLERNDESHVGLTANAGRTGDRLRVARDLHSPVATSLLRCCGRGTGAVMATGSYEESLPAEGIPVITKRLLSRDGADDGLGGFDILRPVPTLRRTGRTVRLQLSRRRVRREGEASKSRHGCQRLGRISAVERKRPRRDSRP
jgi:hypothetical protein